MGTEQKVLLQHFEDESSYHTGTTNKAAKGKKKRHQCSFSYSKKKGVEIVMICIRNED